jgi:putative transposase
VKLQDACSIFYPDYELDWILRTDASTVGVSAALFQLKPTTDGFEWQPIGLASHKFSDAATRWTTIEQEAYGCYFGIQSFEYKLRGKHFTLETDHQNLIWMEKSVVPKIIRWVLYMKSFSFLVRHVPGKLNAVADHLSRYFVNALYDPLLHYFPDIAFDSVPFDTLLLHTISLPTFSLSTLREGGESDEQREWLSNKTDLDSIIAQVHNARRGHWGVRYTMRLLDKEHPGHGIPAHAVSEYIATCPICQKNRQGMVDSISPIVRHLKPEYKRKAIGIDTLTITPPDKYNNQYLIVIVVHFTKLAWGYPAANKDAETLAAAIVTFFSLYGLFDTIMSDPGSDLTSSVIEKLNEYYGVHHVFSLVDRHESNGVEGTNKQILRHLRALVHEERIVNQWSAPTVLPLIFFLLNSHDSSETGMTPFEAHFGTDEATYFKVPKNLSGKENTKEFVRLLDNNLKYLTEKSLEFQKKLIEERTHKNTLQPQNVYQPGDFVLFQSDRPSGSKLSPQYLGPYVVIQQVKNDVTSRHLSSGVVSVLHVERLKRYVGTEKQAKNAANIDYDQYEVDRIIGYTGDTSRRSEMQFELLFKAGDTLWKTYCKDIFDTTYFEDFCRSRPELLPLLTTVAVFNKNIAEINKTPITEFTTGDEAYMNLRFFGYKKYKSFGLPNHERIIYITRITYGNMSKNKCDININIPIFKKKYLVKHEFVVMFGNYKAVDTQKNMVLIDEDYLLTHPSVSLSI